MYNEYVEKLKAFSDEAGGEFSHSSNTTTALTRLGWSRVEIRIPHSTKDLFFIAFSGVNTAEVYSGFYAKTNLPQSLSCTITQKDTFLSLINMFSSDMQKSGRASFDKKLSIKCNKKPFVLKLTGNHDVAKFLESSIQLPLKFEVISNEKGYLKNTKSTAMLITIHTNEWIVDQKKLMELLNGFKMLADHVG